MISTEKRKYNYKKYLKSDKCQKLFFKFSKNNKKLFLSNLKKKTKNTGDY